MHKNSFDWALQLLTNETIQKMPSLKTHMLHSGEANVREDRTQMWEEHRTGQLQEVGARFVGRKTQIKPEGNNWTNGQQSDGLKALCFSEGRWKVASFSIARDKISTWHPAWKTGYPNRKKTCWAFINCISESTAPPCWITCGCTSSFPPQRQTLHSCTPW